MVEGIAWASTTLWEGRWGRECSRKGLLEQHSQASTGIPRVREFPEEYWAVTGAGWPGCTPGTGGQPTRDERGAQGAGVCVYIQNN